MQIEFGHTIIPDTTPTTTTTTNGVPYEKPVILRDSAEISRRVDSADFQICISNYQHVITTGTTYDVDGILNDHHDVMVSPISGTYTVTIKGSDLGSVEGSVIDVHVIMIYYDRYGDYKTKTESDVLSFSFKIDDGGNGNGDNETVIYIPPAVITGTLSYMWVGTAIHVNLSMTYHELVQSMVAFFVLKNTSEQLSYTVEFTHLQAGKYNTIIESLQLPKRDMLIYLTVTYEGETGGVESYTVKLGSLSLDPTKEISPILFIFVGVILLVTITSTIIAIIRRRRKK